MPELPEVEVVRRGLDKWVTGRTIDSVSVLHPRAVRNHGGSQRDFIKRLVGRKVSAISRRGKFMWFVLDDDHAVVAHLGMSGQLLVQPPEAKPEKHLRIKWTFTDNQRALHFVDQRTFGGMAIEPLVAVEHGEAIPQSVVHIARDPLEPHFDQTSTVERMRKSASAIKSVLLNQSIISGVGNIYADEALWRTRLNWATPAQRLSSAKLDELVDNARAVMQEALAQGGTSFDSLYVNVNGESGYFSRELDAYGREDEPCNRCGRLIVRQPFAGRSSFLCTKCQPRPRSLKTP
jgi:formamidopyrimidine-DNA glycosylase